MFILSNATGELSKAKPLDREIKDFYSLLVSASDQGQSPLSSNTTINITILDANDQTPEIHTQTIFIIPEVQLYHFFIHHFINFFFCLLRLTYTALVSGTLVTQTDRAKKSWKIHRIFIQYIQSSVFHFSERPSFPFILLFVRSFTHSFINHSLCLSQDQSDQLNLENDEARKEGQNSIYNIAIKRVQFSFFNSHLIILYLHWLESNIEI